MLLSYILPTAKHSPIVYSKLQRCFLVASLNQGAARSARVPKISLAAELSRKRPIIDSAVSSAVVPFFILHRSYHFKLALPQQLSQRMVV